MTTHAAKKLIKQYLDAEGIADATLTAKTWGFTDLARDTAIFVTIANAHLTPTQWQDVDRIAHANHFHITHTVTLI